MRSIPIPAIAYYPFKVVLFNYYDSYSRKESSYNNSLKNLDNNNTGGNISNKASKKLRTSIEWLVSMSTAKTFYDKKRERKTTFKLNFVTLTLSAKQIHSDYTIKSKLLNKWLEWLRYNYEGVRYIWKAETQKNGNIHFHIVTDKYIDYEVLRDSWNKVQNTLGYINRFFSKYKHTNPNSTDVHSIQKIKNISAYLAKYFTKNETRRKIEGRLWAQSTNLAQLKPILNIEDTADTMLIKVLSKFKDLRKFSAEYCSMLQGDISSKLNTISDRGKEISSKIKNMWEGIKEAVPIQIKPIIQEAIEVIKKPSWMQTEINTCPF